VSMGNVEVVKGEFGDERTLQEALAGVRSVVHCAGRAHRLKEVAADPLAEFRRVNVEATMRVAEAALGSGVECLVFMSSVAAVGPEDSGYLSEDVRPDPATPYGLSKLEAEVALQQLVAGSGLRCPILRPPMVYGPGMRGNPLRLFDWLDRGFPLPFGAIDNSRTMLYVGNLVSAVRALLGSAEAVTGTYFVGDLEPLSTPGFVRRAARALERTPRLVPVPAAVLRGSAWAGDRLRRWLPVPLTSDSLASLCGSLVLDTSKLARATGFRPDISVDEGLDATADWYRHERRP